MPEWNSNTHSPFYINNINDKIDHSFEILIIHWIKIKQNQIYIHKHKSTLTHLLTHTHTYTHSQSLSLNLALSNITHVHIQRHTKRSTFIHRNVILNLFLLSLSSLPLWLMQAQQINQQIFCPRVKTSKSIN